MPTEISGSTGVNKIQSSAIEYGDLPTGSVLQVIHDVDPTAISLTSTSFTDTGLSAQITPKSTSSKILISINLMLQTGNNNATWRALHAKILRDTTGIYQSSDTHLGVHSAHACVGVGISHLDTPSTTSAITYKVQIKGENTSGIEYNYNGNHCQMTLTEIAG
jgi:hypothetical protein